MKQEINSLGQNKVKYQTTSLENNKKRNNKIGSSISTTYIMTNNHRKASR